MCKPKTTTVKRESSQFKLFMLVWYNFCKFLALLSSLDKVKISFIRKSGLPTLVFICFDLALWTVLRIEKDALRFVCYSWIDFEQISERIFIPLRSGIVIFCFLRRASKKRMIVSILVKTGPMINLKILYSGPSVKTPKAAIVISLFVCQNFWLPRKDRLV